MIPNNIFEQAERLGFPKTRSLKTKFYISTLSKYIKAVYGSEIDIDPTDDGYFVSVQAETRVLQNTLKEIDGVLYETAFEALLSGLDYLLDALVNCEIREAVNEADLDYLENRDEPIDLKNIRKIAYDYGKTIAYFYDDFEKYRNMSMTDIIIEVKRRYDAV